MDRRRTRRIECLGRQKSRRNDIDWQEGGYVRADHRFGEPHYWRDSAPVGTAIDLPTTQLCSEYAFWFTERHFDPVTGSLRNGSSFTVQFKAGARRFLASTIMSFLRSCFICRGIQRHPARSPVVDSSVDVFSERRAGDPDLYPDFFVISRTSVTPFIAETHWAPVRNSF